MDFKSKNTKEERLYSNFIEGGSSSTLYTTWQSMIDRCHNTRSKQYKDYGGRGIFVCDEWRNSFKSFYDDMGNKPFKGAQIDRINNDDGYYKENCRWVTKHQNLWNRGGISNSSSIYKGVSKIKSIKKGVRWYSSIARTLNGETITKSKTFDTEI